jgi:hypothetical protein
MKTPTVFLNLSGKGGVSKTTTVANLSSVLLDLGVQHALYSVEIHGHELQRYHPKAVELIMNEVAIDAADEALDALFFAACDGRQHVLVDTGANVGRGLGAWMVNTDFFQQCVDAKIRVVVAITAGSNDHDSYQFFSRFTDLADDQTSWVLFRAQHTGSEFALFDDMVVKTGARVIDLPVVPLRLMELSRQRGQTFLQLAEEKELNVLQRQRCRYFARAFSSALEPLVQNIFT